MEYEIIQHDQLRGIKLLVDDISYRTPHTHREFELILALAGNLTVSCLGEQVSVKQGEMVVLNPWQTHEFQTDGAVCTCLFLQMQPDVFRGYFPSVGRLRFQKIAVRQMLQEDRLQDLRKTAIRLGLAYFSMEPVYELVCMRLIARVFELLIRDGDWILLSSKQAQRETVVQRRLERVMQFVQENYQQKIFLRNVAEQERLSESYMTHFVQENLNMSFQDYVALTRFEHARRLLETTDMTIVEICSECGFSDRRYLNKICLQQTGLSPKEYRKSQTKRRERQSNSNGLTIEHIYSDEEALACLQNLSPDWEAQE
ncbi:MAG: helix-turn-helix transcriptional regulator [Oscillospiraceae bacterium]|nr:helix-turn-helix transcriptional regulator [Oscillospiraceae bacterium]